MTALARLRSLRIWSVNKQAVWRQVVAAAVIIDKEPVPGELLIKPQSAADKALDSDSANGIYPV